MTIADAITGALRERAAGAMFVTELQHALGNLADGAALDASLHSLAQSGELIVVEQSPPDVHLGDIDLRIVTTASPAANEAVATVWHDFLREFLASHRCC